MTRRELIRLLGGLGFAGPLLARAQPSTSPVIGFLHSGSPDPRSSYWSALAALRQGLREGGFEEGRNLHIEFRWAEDQFDRLPLLARDLLQSGVQLMFVGGGDVAALAAKAATTAIPIVFAIGADPVQHGLVASLARPGGNITGATFLAVELRPKMLELARELVPRATSVGVLGNPNRPNFGRMVDEVFAAAKAMGIRVHVMKASSEHEIDGAFAALHVNVDAILVLSDPVYVNRHRQVSERLNAYKRPTVHASRDLVVSGGLVSYGASIDDAYRRAGVYCTRILRGENPAELPVLQPEKFELVINLRTAQTLGVEVPATLLARADEVIE